MEQIIEHIVNTYKQLNEEDNIAYDSRKQPTPELKKLWDVINKLQSELQDKLYLTNEKLSELTQNKLNVMKKQFPDEEFLLVPKMLVYAGNAKLPPNILVVNLSAALYCPSYHGKLCPINQPGTTISCYAQNSENFHWNSTIPHHYRTDLMYTEMLSQYENGNKELFEIYFKLIENYIQISHLYSDYLYQKCVEEAEKQIHGKIPNSFKKAYKLLHDKWRVTEVRLNESGDFPNQLALDLWSDFAKYLKEKYNINTHTYTARRLNFSNAMDNIHINFSNDDENINTGNHKRHVYKAIKKSIYNKLPSTDLEEYAQPILGVTQNANGKKIKYYKCPYYYKNLDCNQCGVCIRDPKDITKDEDFIIYVPIHGRTAKGLRYSVPVNDMRDIIKLQQDLNWYNDTEKTKMN